jgi:hypothetical protein
MECRPALYITESPTPTLPEHVVIIDRLVWAQWGASQEDKFSGESKLEKKRESFVNATGNESTRTPPYPGLPEQTVV